MNLKYINSKGIELPLNGSPYWIEDEALFDYEWTIEESNEKISDIKRKPSKRSATLYIKGSTSSEFNDLMNAFYDVVDFDVAIKSPGKLVLSDGSYSSCYIISSKNKKLNVGRVGAQKEISIYFIDSIWTKETGRAFEKISVEANGLNFPFNFPFNLGIGQATSQRWNTGINVPSDFILTFNGNSSGTVTNPTVNIAGHEYKVFTNIESGQMVTINSRTNEVLKYLSNGTVVNIFNSRNFAQSVFEKIPGGEIAINWSGTFTFSLTLLEKRSEPRWTLS